MNQTLNILTGHSIKENLCRKNTSSDLGSKEMKRSLSVEQKQDRNKAQRKGQNIQRSSLLRQRKTIEHRQRPATAMDRADSLRNRTQSTSADKRNYGGSLSPRSKTSGTITQMMLAERRKRSIEH